MKLSTRNIIKGKVIEVKTGMIMAKVRVDIGNAQTMTAIVTDEAVKQLDVKAGDTINCLVKATSVMLGKE